MILVINLNAAIDRIFFIDRFTPDTHMRTQKALLSIGGKGLCTARVLKSLSADHCAISFIAGKNGKILEELLRKLEINSELIWVPGETREANVIVETDFNRHSHITTTGYHINRVQCDQFIAQINIFTSKAKWAIIAGSVPQGTPESFYKESIELLHKKGVKVLVDISGVYLYEALNAYPEIVKMNQDEFESTFLIDHPENMSEWVSVCQSQMKTSNISSLVLTCGKEGILAFINQGVFHAGCNGVIEKNAAGAGDAVSAALVNSLFQGNSWEKSLTIAAAVGAATAMTDGTAECHQEDINTLYPQVWIKKLI
jgi:1-phosphofructokinase family hexose kinase